MRVFSGASVSVWPALCISEIKVALKLALITNVDISGTYVKCCWLGQAAVAEAGWRGSGGLAWLHFLAPAEPPRFS
jgi:hypothetical protein